MGGKWSVVVKEVKMVSYVAAPMVVTSVLQYLVQVVSVMMVGHLDKLSFATVSIGTSFASVTGFSLIAGMAGALETLCGQAYGAKHYEKLGTYTYTGIVSLTLACVPISLLWLFTDKLLMLIGQDPSISLLARKYLVCLIPDLFSYAVLQTLTRYFQTQSMILPMLFSSCAALCFHVPVCWALVFKVKLGSIGAAFAIGCSFWLNIFLLGVYMKYSSACKKTHAVFSKDVFLSMKEFIRLAIPSAGMVCLEWWSYELLILLSGLLTNPEVETSVLSICFSITYLHYYVPYSFGATASTRVSNELGAGNPQAAKVAVEAIMVLAVAEVVAVSMAIFFCRYSLGYAFSREKEIVDRVADMGPWICLSIIMDSIQAVLSGVARGSGWQHIGAYVNLGAYYLVGTPLGAVLAFVVHLGGKGLWIGLVTGSTVQAALLALGTTFTNWRNQAMNVGGRMLEGAS